MDVKGLWHRISSIPFIGKWLFSFFLGFVSPYSSSVWPYVDDISEGFSQLTIRDRRALRNPFRCIHAIALLNAAECASGLCALYSIDGRKDKAIVTRVQGEFLKKAKGSISAKARMDVPKRHGKHEVVCHVDMENSEGEIVSKAQITWSFLIGEDAQNDKKAQ